VSGRYSLELVELTPQRWAAERVLAVLDEPDLDPGRLADVIEADLALSARLLRFANSITHGAPRRVSSVHHALSLLGVETARALAVSTACTLLDQVADSGPPGFLRHSVLTACTAAELAGHLGTDEASAFSAGLLHDVGAVLLHRRDPQAFAATQTGDDMTAILGAEIAAFGRSHTMVGAEALEAWCFPAAFIEAVALHHGADEPHHLLGRIVRSAETIACRLEPGAGHVPTRSMGEAFAELRIGAGVGERLLGRIGNRLASTVRRLEP
jgi:putative nucleotidyltransferase with HDIG domain